MVSLQHNKATVVLLLFSFAEFCTIDSHHLFIFSYLHFAGSFTRNNNAKYVWTSLTLIECNF